MPSQIVQKIKELQASTKVTEIFVQMNLGEKPYTRIHLRWRADDPDALETSREEDAKVTAGLLKGVGSV